jgi:hypothetical protein
MSPMPLPTAGVPGCEPYKNVALFSSVTGLQEHYNQLMNQYILEHFRHVLQDYR